MALLIAACSSARDGTTTIGGPGLSGDLLVSAAASLTDAFAGVAEAFNEIHPGVEIMFNFGPSSGLREQILEGAPVDVFASANSATMNQVVDAGEVSGEIRTFARNRLVIAVQDGNPAGITGLADFARDDLLIGLCSEGVPCGDYSREALASAGVAPSIDSAEIDVRALITKIAEGELDAGVVYLSDIDGTVEGVEIPSEHNVVADYPIAVLSAARNPAAAQAFVEFVLSAEGQRILAEYGFAST